MNDFFGHQKLGTRDIVYNKENGAFSDREGRGYLWNEIDLHALVSRLPEDVVLACGGDGTLIEAFRRYPERPILPIHFGNRGFLMNQLEDVLKTDTFDISYKETLGITLLGKYFHALNEIAIKSATGYVLETTIVIGKQSFPLKADGCIISTQTGSTAYNLSLGGPLLLSDTTFSFTPIAPLSPRAMTSIVYDIDHLLTLDFGEVRNTDIIIYADSIEIFRGNTSLLQNIEIERGKMPLILLRPAGIPPRSIFDIFSF